MSLIIPIILAVIAYLVVRFWKTAVLMRKFWVYGEKIPGLPAHPILGNLKELGVMETHELNAFFTETAKKMRDEGHKVFRLYLLGKLYVWPLDGEALVPIIDSKTELNKGDDYKFLDPWLEGGLLFEGATERWKVHRKMLTPAFHFAKLDGYLEVFNNESKILVDIMTDFMKTNETFDVFPYIKRCALDVICAAAMGKTVNAQFNTEHNYVKAVQGFNKLSVIYSFRPLLWNPFMFWLLGYKAQKEWYLKILKGFVNDVIAERRQALETGEVEMEKSKRKMNFLDLLLSMEESKGLTAEEIRQEVDTFMFAGHDTTSSSVSWTIWALAQHQDVQQKVYDELKDIVGDSPDITQEHISKFNYFEKVLKETKRLTPPVPIVQRKLINEMEIGGCIIPSGALVNISPMMIHSNHLVYKNPLKFNPENFAPENTVNRHPYDYIPFSAGPRNCIGQRFAQMNEKIMLSHILLNFKIDPAPGIAFEDIKKCPEVVTIPSKGIPIRLTRR